ncbi:hypothetical protein BELL_0271g00100 [Botrytis elliptica]|uniref:Uncharacterized protein n=1 Tax=Botrytis elliptica TaxID=278938 RepID=A0A4Z1JTM7_9HELO|nr:hypothetical protein BELL_0271g00100 [Botrytis elliptica]
MVNQSPIESGALAQYLLLSVYLNQLDFVDSEVSRGDIEYAVEISSVLVLKSNVVAENKFIKALKSPMLLEHILTSDEYYYFMETSADKHSCPLYRESCHFRNLR